MSTDSESATNLLVRFLDHSIDDNALRSFFCRYGTILASIVQRDIHTGQSRGFGFVRFSTHAEAAKALKMGNDALLGRKHINVLWAKKQHDDIPVGEERMQMNKLFVRNVPLSITDVTLARVFSQYGKVATASVHSDTAAAQRLVAVSAQRNIAFITFEEAGVAERALKKVHNTSPFKCCGGIPLMCKLSENYQEREHKTAAPRQAPPLTTADLAATGEENGNHESWRLNTLESIATAAFKENIATAPASVKHLRTYSESFVMKPDASAFHPAHERTVSAISGVSCVDCAETSTDGAWRCDTLSSPPQGAPTDSVAPGWLVPSGVSPSRAPTHLYYNCSSHRARTPGSSMAPPPSPRLAPLSGERTGQWPTLAPGISMTCAGRYMHNPYAIQCLME